jgi:hypothetical protein
MKKQLLTKAITFILSTLLINFVSIAQTIPPKSFLVCGDTQVLIVDYNQSKDSIPAVIWTWDAREA